ncbi:hypothetical protein HAX54_011791 [Datura stramonium]|uniref:GAG-pre-integrase domain-containing protein n=1 Tax=Datura stramonium TaxID=4076 RepID=A0ABS8TJL4_DATST|nr:hypothetical protein [Datura stramonium]
MIEYTCSNKGFKGNKGWVVARLVSNGVLRKLDCPPLRPKEVALSALGRGTRKIENASSYNEVELWHRRLGHLHASKTRNLGAS